MSDSSDEEELSASEESSEAEYDPVPKPIKGTIQFTDISFHPAKKTYLAATDICGYVYIYQCDSGEKSVEKAKRRISKKPSRCMAFSSDGEEILVMTKDRVLHVLCSSTAKTKNKFEGVHESSPYSMCVINKNLLASGDENGTLKIWDLRRGSKPVMEEDAFDDYVSGVAVDDKKRLIFATSGDGTMSTFDARKRKLVVQSIREKEDLLCAQVIKCNSKLVVGCATGYTLLYNWNEFASAVDRFPGHKGTIDCMTKMSEDVICTGSSDGYIRAIRILPNRFLGVVGKHHGFPIEKIRTNVDCDWLASISHDSTVRFWPVDFLHSMEVDTRRKADKSRHFRRITRDGLVNRRAAFVADIDKDLQVPVCAVDSDDATTSEEDGADE